MRKINPDRQTGPSGMMDILEGAIESVSETDLTPSDVLQLAYSIKTYYEIKTKIEKGEVTE